MGSPRSLSSKLAFWYLLSFVLLVGGGFAATWFTVNHILERDVVEELQEDIVEFRKIYLLSGLAGLRDEITKEQSEENNLSEYYVVFDRNGRQIQVSRNRLAVKPQTSETIKRFLADGEDVIDSVYHKIRVEDEIERIEFRQATFALAPNLIMKIGESTAEKTQVMATLRNAFLLIIGVIVPLAGVVGWLMLGNLLSGVKEVGLIAKRIQQGHIQDRVSVQSGDKEIVQLSQTFNKMLDTIHDLVSEMREMTDNIAHDLKSPVARIRFMSEVSLSNALSEEEQIDTATQTIDECDRLLKMINISLDVAEAEAGVKSNDQEKVDMSALITDACDLFQPVAELNSISLSSDISPGGSLVGNQSALQRMVANLLDNAIKYSNEGDSVSVKFIHDNDNLRLTVADTGIGISQENVKFVFNRFFRCDRSRAKEGCGLGLSYSRAIAKQYNGDITVLSKRGEGSIFELVLSRATKKSSATRKISNNLELLDAGSKIKRHFPDAPITT